MENNNDNKTNLEKLSLLIKNRQRKVQQKELEDIPLSTLQASLIIHMALTSLFILHAQVTPYSNGIDIFACFYSTFALCGLAYHFRNRIKVPIQRSIKFILVSTIVGLGVGSIAYYTPVGDTLQQKEFNNFFENKKLLIGHDYYETYLKNKDNIDELRILRERIYKELNI